VSAYCLHPESSECHCMAQADAPIDAFYGDGAYGQWKVYGRLAAAAIEAIIPPRKNAALLLAWAADRERRLDSVPSQ